MELSTDDGSLQQQLLALRTTQIKQLVDKNQQWQLYCDQLQQELNDKQLQIDQLLLDVNGSNSQVQQLQREKVDLLEVVETVRRQLSESEQSRLSLQEDLDRSHVNFQSEISNLRSQLVVYEEEWKSEGRERERLQAELSATRLELEVMQSQAAMTRKTTMQELAQRRQESLDRYRNQYQRDLQQQQQRQQQQQQQYYLQHNFAATKPASSSSSSSAARYHSDGTASNDSAIDDFRKFTSRIAPSTGVYQTDSGTDHGGGFSSDSNSSAGEDIVD